MGVLGRMLRGVRAGDAHLVWARLEGPQTLVVSSTDFDDGGQLARQHAGEGVGANISPALEWTGVPVDAAALLLVIEDRDVPLPRPIIHVIATMHPVIESLARGQLAHSSAGVDLLAGSLGGIGYAGPRPIVDHGPHHYVFQLFALDREVGSIDEAVGHVLARGRITGTYER